MKNCRMKFQAYVVILSLCLLIGVVIVGIVKIRNNKKHTEKWKDYDITLKRDDMLFLNIFTKGEINNADNENSD